MAGAIMANKPEILHTIRISRAFMRKLIVPRMFCVATIVAAIQLNAEQ